MLRNYFKTALRFLEKNKAFSFINIIGLAMGTLCCLYILLYVQEQYSYDKHYDHAGDIYRVNAIIVLGGDKHNDASTSPPIAPALKHDFSEVLQYTRVVPTFGADQHLLRYKEKSLWEKRAYFVDSTFFDVFTYHFTNGNALNVLSEPYSVVLMKATSDKLFGVEDPVGKFINIDNNYGRHLFKVTGVVDERLGKSHIHANLFLTMNSGGVGDSIRRSDSWAGNNMAASYVKFYPHTSVASVQERLPAFLNKYAGEQMKSLGMEKRLELQPVRTIHTSPQYEGGMDKAVSPSFLYTLLLIAALIQVIACINFMNLSTARASNRAKEVGVRKVIGAGRGDLVKQFLSESFLLTLMGVLVALPLLGMVLPYLNEITQSSIQLSLTKDWRLWGILGVLVVITGFVAGSYPALYLSAFQAIKVIKGNFTNQVSAAGIRRSLVIFQFVLSIVLITGIIVIYSQLSYMENKDLGFEKEQRLIFTFHTDDTKSKMSSFSNDLRQLAEVKVVSKANNYPSHYVFSDFGVFLSGGNMATAPDAQNMTTDEYFVKATGIRLISGRDFRYHDSSKVLINETLAKRLGLKPEAAPGTRLYTQMSDRNPTPVVYEIAGVMKDFNYNSLRTDIMPFMLEYGSGGASMSHLIVSTDSRDYKSLLNKMQAIWHKDIPEAPFEYQFLDEEVQRQYETETTLGHIINLFTLMAILISCLGLFGLAAFSAEQRNKEIGIRKVLGASVPGIVQLLSKDFLKLVLIAIVIATPIAWWAMREWLEAFAYRIPLRWWIFAIAGLLAILIALGTVSFQAIRAARANPVKSLKAE
ncbi:MAG TPA: ABC transporter permease [Puia sp.]|nr:ABC transporter permease [Puia sp.]